MSKNDRSGSPGLRESDPQVRNPLFDDINQRPGIGSGQPLEFGLQQNQRFSLSPQLDQELRPHPGDKIGSIRTLLGARHGLFRGRDIVHQP